MKEPIYLNLLLNSLMTSKSSTHISWKDSSSSTLLVWVLLKPPKFVPSDGGGCKPVEIGQGVLRIWVQLFSFALVVNIHDGIQIYHK